MAQRPHDAGVVRRCGGSHRGAAGRGRRAGWWWAELWRLDALSALLARFSSLASRLLAAALGPGLDRGHQVPAGETRTFRL